MAEKLGEALLDLDTNDTAFRKGIRRGERLAEGLGRTLDATSNRAAALGRSLALGAAAGASALALAVGRAVRSVSELNAQARTAGVNVESFQRLKYAVEQNFVAVDALADGLKELQLRADEFIITGQGPGAEAFRRLGLEADVLKEKLADPEALFIEIIARMGELDQAAQIRIADEIFGGTGGEQFVRLLGDSADGLKELTQEAERLGLVISGEDVAAAEDLQRTLNRLGTTVDVLGLKVGAGVTPELDELADKLGDPRFVANATALAQGVVGAMNLIIDAIELAGTKLSQLGSLVEWMSTHDWGTGEIDPAKMDARRRGALAEIAGQLDRGDFEAPGSDFFAGFGFGGKPPEAPSTGGGGMPPGGFGVGSGTSAETDAVAELIGRLRDELAILNEMDPVQRKLLALRSTLTDATTEQRTEVEALITQIEQEGAAWEAAQAAGQFFGDQLINSIEALRTGSKSLVEVLDDVINALAQAVLQSMLLGQGPLAGLFGTQNAAGGIGGMLGSLFSGFFAEGGLIPKGTFGIVGENGPEPVIGTSRGAMVLPHSSLAETMGSGGGRGDTHVTINGSGLTQAELTTAIGDALERYDRFTLPQRVNEINNDPLARG